MTRDSAKRRRRCSLMTAPSTRRRQSPTLDSAFRREADARHIRHVTHQSSHEKHKTPRALISIYNTSASTMRAFIVCRQTSITPCCCCCCCYCPLCKAAAPDNERSDSFVTAYSKWPLETADMKYTVLFLAETSVLSLVLPELFRWVHVFCHLAPAFDLFP